LVEVTRELKQRLEGRRSSERQTELDLALQEAALTLEALLPKQEKRARRPRSADTTVPLQEAKRKAIRTALQAGIPPAQVAKHFGLPLSAVRQALSKAK
jgi:DNA-directed RNA polymerase specialized sigma24 family protein